MKAGRLRLVDLAGVGANHSQLQKGDGVDSFYGTAAKANASNDQ